MFTGCCYKLSYSHLDMSHTLELLTVSDFLAFLTRLSGTTDEVVAALFIETADKNQVNWDRPGLWPELPIQEHLRMLRSDPPTGGATEEYLFARVLKMNEVKCHCFRPCDCD